MRASRSKTVNAPTQTLEMETIISTAIFVFFIMSTHRFSLGAD
ncbi:MAG: hypothetical protein AAFO63_13605 [Pseudomonadota bacterium]